jgi:hypothetical protein
LKQKATTMARSIRALCLEMAGTPYRAIIVQPADRMAAAAQAGGNQTWLSVRAGDRILLNGKLESIRSVSLYDVIPASECDKPVTCGADWLAQGGP